MISQTFSPNPRTEKSTTITISGVNLIINKTQGNADFYTMVLFETPLIHSLKPIVCACVCVCVCVGGG